MSWRRWINRTAAPISAVVGIFIVFCGVLFVDSDFAKIVTIALGLLVMQGGVWYMANPVLTSERRYTRLRDEIDDFINLVRQLNQAVVAKAPSDELEKLSSAMHESVDKMTALAGSQSAARAAPETPESAQST